MAGIYDEQILGAKQQAETARKLREGITSPQGQMVSGWYVAPSITQHLANALKMYSAGKQEREAMSEYERLRKQKEQETADIYAQMQARPQSVYSEEGPQQPFREPTERERMSALLRGVSVNPEAFQPQLQMAQYEMSQADKERARKDQMQFQREMQQERIQSQQEMARQAAADRRSLAAMTMANRPEKLITVMDESGTPFTIPQSQFSKGMQLYSPQAAKAASSKKQQGEARQQMTDLVSQLGGYYDTLEKGGGIQSTKQGGLSNIAARAQSSGLGQMVGGAFGTQNQSARESIAMTRPLLLNAIKNATGMSAQQMNSNAEMQLYLNAATNPQLGVEANRRALENLDNLYGLGMFKAGRAQKQGQSSGGVIRYDAQGNRIQ